MEGDVGSIAMRRVKYRDKPALSDVQLAAPLVVLNKPPAVTAYTVAGEAGSIANALTLDCDVPSRPALATAQLRPPSMVLKTPASVPA